MIKRKKLIFLVNLRIFCWKKNEDMFIVTWNSSWVKMRYLVCRVGFEDRSVNEYP